MTAKPKLTFTFADIEAQTGATAATALPVEFEPFDKNGNPSGVILLVLSDQAPAVQDGIIKFENADRERQAFVAAKARGARPGSVYDKVEDTREHYHRLTALRIVGWKGALTEEYTPDNAVRLLKLIPAWATQVLAKSADLGGFTSTSSTS